LGQRAERQTVLILSSDNRRIRDKATLPGISCLNQEGSLAGSLLAQADKVLKAAIIGSFGIRGEKTGRQFAAAAMVGDTFAAYAFS